MSVLKRKRNISKMEFYHNAIKLRLMITELLLKDFGIKSRRRNLDFAKDVYDMAEEDVQEIEDILSAYDIKNSFIDNFPTWLIDKERDYFMDLLRDMMKNICSANTNIPAVHGSPINIVTKIENPTLLFAVLISFFALANEIAGTNAVANAILKDKGSAVSVSTFPLNIPYCIFA